MSGQPCANCGGLSEHSNACELDARLADAARIMSSLHTGLEEALERLAVVEKLPEKWRKWGRGSVHWTCANELEAALSEETKDG